MKSIFFLWHLIISMITLKGGDGDGAGDNSDDDNSSSNHWTTQSFTNPETGHKGTITYDQKGNFNVHYDNNKGFGYSDALNDGKGGSYSYEDITGDGVADATYDYENKTLEYNSESVGEFDGGVLRTYVNGKLSYTQEFMDINGDEISVGKEEFSLMSPTSWLDSIIPDVNINGHRTGLLGDIGYTLGSLVDDKSAIVGAKIGAVVEIGIDLFMGKSLIKSGKYMIDAGKMLGASNISVAGYVTLASGFFNLANNLRELNNLFGGYTNNISMTSDFIDEIGNNDKLKSTFKEAVKQYKADNYQKKMYVSSILDNSIYDKMAGGIVYNSVMSGGYLWGATKVANTSFSVAEPLKLGVDVIRSNYPYSKYAGSYKKNLAGDKGFSVLKFKE